jgi:hypothetical protein
MTASVSYTFRAKRPLAHAIQRAAHAQGLTISAMIRRAIESDLTVRGNETDNEKPGADATTKGDAQ